MASRREKRENPQGSMSKNLTVTYTVFGIIWISATIVLAFLGQGETALGILSYVVPVTCIPIICYFASKTVENVFKYNDVFNNRYIKKEEHHEGK